MKKCLKCDGVGWLLACPAIRRCEACRRFKNDLTAAIAFLKQNRDYYLNTVMVCKFIDVETAHKKLKLNNL